MTCRTLEDFYYIDGHTFEKQYKEVLSGYRDWSELAHADEWLVFADNIGPNLAIDETSLSNGELVHHRDQPGPSRRRVLPGGRGGRHKVRGCHQGIGDYPRGET